MIAPRDKKEALLDRIAALEEALVRANEYLESGKHADWSGFRPLLVSKQRDGRDLPPHRDWVKSVFIPSKERALSRAERSLERLSQSRSSHAG